MVTVGKDRPLRVILEPRRPDGGTHTRYYDATSYTVHQVDDYRADEPVWQHEWDFIDFFEAERFAHMLGDKLDSHVEYWVL